MRARERKRERERERERQRERGKHNWLDVSVDDRAEKKERECE